MCGISFIYNSVSPVINNNTIEMMTACLNHRGPDAQQTVVKQHAALGHTRLSIVDIKGGSQPMATSDGRYTIIYNGELYNYLNLRKELESKGAVFNTQSDTEVVLQMYIRFADNCVSYLRGMFSFVVHDNEYGRLFIARDRLGIKPLYYSWDGKLLVGASEIKSIFASTLIEPELNLDSIVNYFKYQFSVAPHTPFMNVYELEPGYALTIEPGVSPQIKQYWDLDFPEDEDYEPLQEWEWEVKFQDALDDAIVTHMIGEVNIGAYLSGGIDSATTTYMLSKHYDNDVESFTIEFTNTANDESDIARAIASHIHVPNSSMILDDDRPGGFLDLLVEAIYHLEQPQRVAVDIPHFMLSDYVHSKHYKVIYTGDGADEILAGYDCYRQDMIRIWGNDIPDPHQREEFYLTRFVDNFSDQYMRHLLKLHEPSVQDKTIKHYGCYPVWYDTWQVLSDVGERLLRDEVKQKTMANSQMDQLVERMKPKIKNRHPVNQSLYIETKTRLPGWILWKSDRLSMAHSVEARVPFMDHKLVELAAQIPPWFKLNGMDEKYILKKIMAPHMPAHPQQFKKRAFYTPIKEWFFTTEKVAALEKYMSKDAISKAGVFDALQVEGMINEIVNLPAPQTMDDYYSLMKLEWGLMLVLTVQILHWLYVDKNAPCFRM